MDYSHKTATFAKIFLVPFGKDKNTLFSLIKNVFLHIIMNKELLITLIKKDLRELQTLTNGFMEMDVYPETIVHLAVDKAQAIADNLQQLQQAQWHAASVSEPVERPAHSSAEQQHNHSSMAVSEHALPIDDASASVVPVSESKPPILDTEPVEKAPLAKEAIPEASENTAVPEPNLDTCKETKNASVNDTVCSRSLFDDYANMPDKSLATAISQKHVADLSKAITLADRFRFKRELFGNDGEKMETVISALNKLGSFKDVEDYLARNLLKWNKESDVVKDFLAIVARKFK